MIKLKNKIVVQTKEKITILNNNFVDHLFSIYQLKTYIGEFINFVYALNKQFESEQEEKKTQDIINNNYFISNVYSNVYNRYLSFINNLFFNNVYNEYQLREIINKVKEIRDVKLLNSYLLKNDNNKIKNIFINSVKNVVLNKISEIQNLTDIEKRTLKNEIIKLNLEKFKENNYLSDKFYDKTEDKNSEIHVYVSKIVNQLVDNIKLEIKKKNILSDLKINEIEKALNDKKNIKIVSNNIKQYFNNKVINNTEENVIKFLKKFNKNKFVLNKNLRFVDHKSFDHTEIFMIHNRQYNENNYKQSDIVAEMFIKAVKNLMINKILKSKEFTQIQKQIIESEVNKLIMKNSYTLGNIINNSNNEIENNILSYNDINHNLENKIENYYDERQIYGRNINNENNIIYISNVIQSLKNELKEGLKEKNIFSSLQLRQIELMIENKKNIKNISEVVRKYINNETKNIENENNTSLITNSLIENKEENWNKTNVIMVHNLENKEIERLIKEEMERKIIETRELTEVQKEIIREEIKKIKIDSDKYIENKMENYYDERQIYSSDINNENNIVYISNVIQSLKNELKEGLKEKNIFSSLQLRQIELMIENKKNIKNISEVVRKYINNETKNIENENNTSLITNSLIENKEENWNKTNVIMVHNNLSYNNYVNNPNSVLGNAMIEIVKNIVVNQVLKSKEYTNSQKLIAEDIINGLKFDNEYFYNYYDEREIYNDLNNKSSLVIKFIDNIKNNIVSELKNKNIFSHFQLKNIEKTVSNKKNIKYINKFINSYFNKFSNDINEVDVNSFFNDLSYETLIDIEKNNILNEVQNKNIISKKVNNIFSDIYNKYSIYKKNEDDEIFNNFKITLLNKVENIFNEEIYENFIDKYLKDKEKKLRDKIVIKKQIHDIISDEVSFYKRKDRIEFKNLNNIYDQILFNSINKLYNNLNSTNINSNLKKIDKKINDIIIKNIINKVNNNKDYIKFIDYEFNRLERKVISKNILYKFIKNYIGDENLVKHDNVIINSINKVLEDNSSVITNDLKKQSFIENEINSFIKNNLKNENQINYLKEHNVINKNDLYFIGRQNKIIDFIYKKDNIGQNVDKLRYIDEIINKRKINNEYLKNQNEVKILKFKDNIIILKDIKNIKKESQDIIIFNKYKQHKNKYFIDKSDKYLFMKNNNQNINNILINPLELISNHKKNMKLSLSEIGVIDINKYDGIKNFVLKNSDFKNNFENFQDLKIIHKQSDNNKNSMSDVNNLDSVKKSTRTIEFNHNIRNINRNQTKDINETEKINVINNKLNQQYDKIIKKAIDDKVNKNIQDITNQVYNNIEKRLKAEQRRSGIL